MNPIQLHIIDYAVIDPDIEDNVLDRDEDLDRGNNEATVDDYNSDTDAEQPRNHSVQPSHVTGPSYNSRSRAHYDIMKKELMTHFCWHLYSLGLV